MGQKIAFATANQNWEANPQGWGWIYDYSTSPPTTIPGTQGDYDWLNLRVKNSCFNGFPFPILETYWSYTEQVEKPVTVWDGLSKAPDDNINFGTALVGPGTPWCLEFNNLEDLFQYYWRVKKVELKSGSVKSEGGGGYNMMNSYSLEYNASNENPKLSSARDENPVLHRGLVSEKGFTVYAELGENRGGPWKSTEDDCPDDWAPNVQNKNETSSGTSSETSPTAKILKDFQSSKPSWQAWEVSGETGPSINYEGIIYSVAEQPEKLSCDCFGNCWDFSSGALSVSFSNRSFYYPVYKVGEKYYARLVFDIGLRQDGSHNTEAYTVMFSGPPSHRELLDGASPLTPGTLNVGWEDCDLEGPRNAFEAFHDGYGGYSSEDDDICVPSGKLEKKIINVNFMAFDRQIATAKVAILIVELWEKNPNQNPDPEIFSQVTISDNFTFEAVEYYEYANSAGQPIWDKNTGAQLRDPVTGE